MTGKDPILVRFVRRKAGVFFYFTLAYCDKNQA